MIRVFVLLIETVILLKKKLLKIIGTWMDSGCYFGDRRLENGSDFPKKKKFFFFFFSKFTFTPGHWDFNGKENTHLFKF